MDEPLVNTIEKGPVYERTRSVDPAPRRSEKKKLFRKRILSKRSRSVLTRRRRSYFAQLSTPRKRKFRSLEHAYNPRMFHKPQFAHVESRLLDYEQKRKKLPNIDFEFSPRLYIKPQFSNIGPRFLDYRPHHEKLVKEEQTQRHSIASKKDKIEKKKMYPKYSDREKVLKVPKNKPLYKNVRSKILDYRAEHLRLIETKQTDKNFVKRIVEKNRKKNIGDRYKDRKVKTRNRYKRVKSRVYEKQNRTYKYENEFKKVKRKVRKKRIHPALRVLISRKGKAKKTKKKVGKKRKKKSRKM